MKCFEIQVQQDKKQRIYQIFLLLQIPLLRCHLKEMFEY